MLMLSAQMLAYVIAVLENARVSKDSMAVHANEVRVLVFSAIILGFLNYFFSNFNSCTASCEDECSGHGSCQTVHDITAYDGFGYDYSIWDNVSLTMCNCGDRYYGSDCSLGNSNIEITLILLLLI